MKDLKLKVSVDTGDSEISLDGIIEKLSRILELKKAIKELDEPEIKYVWEMYPDGDTTIYKWK